MNSSSTKKRPAPKVDAQELQYSEAEFQDAGSGESRKLVRCGKCRVGIVVAIARSGESLGRYWRQNHQCADPEREEIVGRISSPVSRRDLDPLGELDEQRDCFR